MMSTHRNRRVTVQLTKSEAAALLDHLDGVTRRLPRINERGNRPALVGTVRAKTIAALERAMLLDSERRTA